MIDRILYLVPFFIAGLLLIAELAWLLSILSRRDGKDAK